MGREQSAQSDAELSDDSSTVSDKDTWTDLPKFDVTPLHENEVRFERPLKGPLWIRERKLGDLK